MGTFIVIIVAAVVGIPLPIVGVWLACAYWLVVVGYLAGGWFGAFLGLIAMLIIRAIAGTTRSRNAPAMQ